MFAVHQSRLGTSWASQHSGCSCSTEVILAAAPLHPPIHPIIVFVHRETSHSCLIIRRHLHTPIFLYSHFVLWFSPYNFTPFSCFWTSARKEGLGFTLFLLKLYCLISFLWFSQVQYLIFSSFSLPCMILPLCWLCYSALQHRWSCVFAV